MVYSHRDVRSALTGKLGFIEDDSGRHIKFIRQHGEQVVGLTHMSHGSSGDDISRGILGAMARQLKVTSPEFRKAIDCTIDRRGFLTLLVERRE